MSVEAITWALRVPVGGNAKVILLGLANHAHPDGTESYPALDTLAEYAACDRSTARRNLRLLRDSGWIVEDGKGPKGQTKFRLLLEGGWQNATGGTGARGGVAPMPPEPSIEPSLEEVSIEPSSSEAAAPEPQSSHTNGNGNRMVPPGPGPRALCRRLAELMIANDPKAKVDPESKRWLDSARLLVDTDGRHFEEAIAVLEWCQADEFERTVVLSMPKFRKRYGALRLKWLRERQSAAAARTVSRETPPIATTADLVAAYQMPRSRTGL
jgi:hypothetical protein